MNPRARYVASVTLALAACHRTTPHDASVDARPLQPSMDAAIPVAPPLGPPNPWGDGGLPTSTASGPEADATRASLNALRASVGFWRIARNLRDHCPTLADLASTPASAFDPTTMGHDAWGRAFEIDCQGARVRLRSWGPDGVRDTPDDLFSE